MFDDTVPKRAEASACLQRGLASRAAPARTPPAFASARKSPRPRRPRFAIAAAATLLIVANSVLAQPQRADGRTCGELLAVETHDATTTRYVLDHPRSGSSGDSDVALVLLVGGGGRLDLDDGGCPRMLVNNSLVRSLPQFHDQRLITALVDVPTDHVGVDGLGGFRITAKHADDIGKVIADLRTRTRAAIWLVGTSRGSISAANAASRLSGKSAPDGLVLTSPVTAGAVRSRSDWVRQSVFDLPLDAIRMPVLLVGHAADKCVRSPPDGLAGIAARIRSERRQVVVVDGPATYTQTGVDACEALAAHGFVGQESEVAAGIARFVRGGRY